MQAELGLEGVVLRPVYYWESEAEKHFDTLYLCEAHMFPETSSELIGCGVPAMLMHGDFHFGNVAVQGDGFVILDWTDACITHSFLDIAHIVSFYKEPERGAAYLKPWQSALPAAQVKRAFALAEVLMPIFFAQTYARIVASLEPSSRWEFEDEIEAYMAKLAVKLREG